MDVFVCLRQWSCLSCAGSDALELQKNSNEPSRSSRGRAVVAGAFVCGLVLAVALVTGEGDAKRTSLAMMDDIATINDIHAAYIHGSVPTAKGESDDIMNMNFPDEVGICI